MINRLYINDPSTYKPFIHKKKVWQRAALHANTYGSLRSPGPCSPEGTTPDESFDARSTAGRPCGTRLLSILLHLHLQLQLHLQLYNSTNSLHLYIYTNRSTATQHHAMARYARLDPAVPKGPLQMNPVNGAQPFVPAGRGCCRSSTSSSTLQLNKDTNEIPNEIPNETNRSTATTHHAIHYPTHILSYPTPYAIRYFTPRTDDDGAK